MNLSSRSIFLLALAAFASSASFRVCDPMLPVLAELFATSVGQAAHVITAFVITYGVMQVIYGPLGERFERFRLVTIATACCAVGSLGAAAAQSLVVLTFFRVVTGISAAGIIPMSMAYIADAVGPEERQATLARFFSGQILGMVCGQVLGGLCVDTIGWRWAFGLLAVLYLGIGAALWQGRTRPAVVPAKALARPPILALYGRAARMLVDPACRSVLANLFVEAAIVFAVLAFIPLYLHQHFGQPMAEASLALVLYGAGGLAYSLYASRRGARLNRPRYPLLASLLVAIADALLLFANHPAWAFLAALIFGFGYYMLHNALLFQVTQMAPQARSLAMAVAISLFFVGQSLGVGLAGLLVDAGAITAVFAVAAVIAPLVGIATAWRIRRQDGA